MFRHLLLWIILFQTIEAKDGARLLPPAPKKWMTLNGGRPEVVAHGGYSGYFPDSSVVAYTFALESGINGTIQYCNLHFTKDNYGFCIADMNLQNATNIAAVDPEGAKLYNINGNEVHGYFGLDYTAEVIFNQVRLIQRIYSRPEKYDGLPMTPPFLLFQDRRGKPARLWLNIENDMFYKKHNITAEGYILDGLKELPEFISSPEIGFLKSIGSKMGKSKTKLLLAFLEQDMIEPTTETPYGSLVKNLSKITSFAYGIVVPKDYIWPVDKNRLLQPATSLVQDAHEAGLAVFASGFANDNYLSFNYSYDPGLEYLQFIDNSQFSVDGVLSEFPSTASSAIGCLNKDKKAPRQIRTLIISHNGASGDYPGATDLAYQKAIDDGADILDCSVQLTKDGVGFCHDRPELLNTTTAADTNFVDRATTIPEYNPRAAGVYSFDLTWSEIQTLKPLMESTFDLNLIRNPTNKNAGKFVTLAEFLELAKTSKVQGVLISIQRAAYLAAKRGLDLVGTVSSALSDASFDKHAAQKVLILSEDSQVLAQFKGKNGYQTVLNIQPTVSEVPVEVMEELKKYADAVFVHRNTIAVSYDYIYNFTKLVPCFHAANISVYVGIIKNEFQNLALDYLSDPYVELSTFLSQRVDGVVTDFPITAANFFRSSCRSKGATYRVDPVKPGYLVARELLKPHKPARPLIMSDVVDPPLPSVAKIKPAPESHSNKENPQHKSE